MNIIILKFIIIGGGALLLTVFKLIKLGWKRKFPKFSVSEYILRNILPKDYYNSFTSLYKSHQMWLSTFFSDYSPLWYKNAN